MDRATWEFELQRDGFELSEGAMAEGKHITDHTHPFDARLYVLSGEMTITRNGEAQTYGPGNNFEVLAGENHAETVGTAEVTYLVGRRSA